MMNRGDRVLVRTYGGYPCVRRLWDATRYACIVAEEAAYERMLAGDVSGGVGVPAEDVFELPGDLAALDLHQPFTGWDGLRPYRAMVHA